MWQTRSMQIFVTYRARVDVEVDEASGRVVSVCVNDEDISVPEGAYSVNGSISPETARRAVEAAERESWPAWRIGSP